MGAARYPPVSGRLNWAGQAIEYKPFFRGHWMHPKLGDAARSGLRTDQRHRGREPSLKHDWCSRPYPSMPNSDHSGRITLHFRTRKRLFTEWFTGKALWKELSITLGLDAELLGPHTLGSSRRVAGGGKTDLMGGLAGPVPGMELL